MTDKEKMQFTIYNLQSELMHLHQIIGQLQSRVKELEHERNRPYSHFKER